MSHNGLEYVLLLAVQRELHNIPRGMGRFENYLSRMLYDDRDDVVLLPLVIVNPMAKEHVADQLDQLLAMDADGIAKEAALTAWDRLVQGFAFVGRASQSLGRPYESESLHHLDVEFKVSLVVADDLMGGWTNRYADEHTLRFENGPHRKRFWITGVLWSRETPSKVGVRETIFAAIYRTAWILEHGPAETLREKLAQEGYALAAAGCTQPRLDDEDIEYTREVVEPHLESRDMRTAIECLFGDAAGQTLGFTARGLSPWAGLAMALHDARKKQGVSIHFTGQSRSSYKCPSS